MKRKGKLRCRVTTDDWACGKVGIAEKRGDGQWKVRN